MEDMDSGMKKFKTNSKRQDKPNFLNEIYMSDKRIIKVNPDLFKIPDTTKRKEAKTTKANQIKSNHNNNNTTVKRNY